MAELIRLNLISQWSVQTEEKTGPVGFTVEGNSIKFHGVVARGHSAPFAMLPQAYRPSYDQAQFTFGETGMAEVTIRKDGLMSVKSTNPDAWISLNNLHFVCLQ